MLTREDVARDYRLSGRGTVESPGKFEGQSWWAVALWDLVLNGCADAETEDDDGTVIAHFDVTPDLEATAGLGTHPKDREILIWETSSGFVGLCMRVRPRASR